MMAHPKSHQPTEITTSQLEKWFAQLATPRPNTVNYSAITTQLLGRFGLKNAQEVLQFLKSHAGQSLVTMINNELLEQEEINHSVRTEQQEQRLHRRHFLLLLLGLLYEHDAEAKQHNLATQEEMDAKRHRQEKVDQSKDESTLFEETTQALEAALANTIKEAEQLENEIASLHKEKLEIESRYQIYSRWLHDETRELDPNHIDNAIANVGLERSSYVSILSSLLHEGKETEAKETFAVANALQLKMQQLESMKQAQQQEKHFLNRHAEPVKKFGQADFILPKDKTLSREGNQYYLHPIKSNFNTFSPQQKHEAQTAYQRSRYDLMSVRMQLQLNRAEEIALHQNKRNTLSARSENIQQNIHLLTKQLAKIRQVELVQSNANTPTPRPTPLMQKPKLQHVPIKELIHQSRLHLENLMSNHPTQLAKKRMEELMLLEELKLTKARSVQRSSPTPRR